MLFPCFSGVSPASIYGQNSSTARVPMSRMKERRNGSILCRSSKRTQQKGLWYHSLLAYGRGIFQLCVGTLLFGAHLGARSGLRDKLVTNQERFQFICKTLDDDTLPVPDRFVAIDEAVALTSEFRFVRETGLFIDTMTGAVQRAAKYLLLCNDPVKPVFKQRIEDLAAAQRSRDSFEVLAALQALNDLRITEPTDPQSPPAITRRLAEVVWHYTFMHYFWLKEQQDRGQPPE